MSTNFAVYALLISASLDGQVADSFSPASETSAFYEKSSVATSVNKSPPPVMLAANDSDASTSTPTEVQIAGTKDRVSLRDAEQMRDALLQYLRESQIGDRDELIQGLQNARAEIGPDGEVRIGRWQLASTPRGLVLSFRFAGGEDFIVSYHAIVDKRSDKWVVTHVAPQFIHRSR